MSSLSSAISFLRSKTLTAWLLGLFIFYYLTLAVWSDEAFAKYVGHLSSNNFFRAFYLLFLINMVFRTWDILRAAWSEKVRFFLQCPFYLGLVLVLFSFFLSLNFRKVEWLPPTGVGDIIKVPWDSRSYQIVSVVPAIKKKALRTDDSAIFDYEPGAALSDPEGRTYTIGAFPPRKVGQSYMHVLTFGIGPDIEVRKQGKTIWKRPVALRLIPFGVVDVLEIPVLPHRFFISIVPNKIIKKGRETAKDYDLDRPRYYVEITKGDSILARQEIEKDILFDDGLSLHLESPSDWVLIEAAYDPFLIWFAGSIFLFAVGAFTYPAYYIVRAVYQFKSRQLIER